MVSDLCINSRTFRYWYRYQRFRQYWRLFRYWHRNICCNIPHINCAQWYLTFKNPHFSIKYIICNYAQLYVISAILIAWVLPRKYDWKLQIRFLQGLLLESCLILSSWSVKLHTLKGIETTTTTPTIHELVCGGDWSAYSRKKSTDTFILSKALKCKNSHNLNRRLRKNIEFYG